MNASTLGFGSRPAEELPTGTAFVPAQRTPVMDSTTGGGIRAATVLIVDPDPGNATALGAALQDVGVGAVLTAPSPEAVSELVDRAVVGDLALVSLAYGKETIRLITRLRAAGWQRVLVLAPTADIGPVTDAIGVGVNGVLIGRRANPVAANVPPAIHDLSSREVEVIRLVADGRSNKWIGDQLCLSALTVKSHLARIGRKLGTGDRAHMVALALRAGVIS